MFAGDEHKFTVHELTFTDRKHKFTARKHKTGGVESKFLPFRRIIL